MADPDDQQTEVAHPEMKNGAAMTEDAAHADTPVAGPSDTKGTTPVDAASTFTMETEEGLLLASTTDDVQDAEKGAKEVSSTERNVDEGVKGNGRDAEEEKKEQSKKPAEGDEFSDDESYHSPGEEEYKSESDGASGLLRGRRREASDEEDEDEDDEDAISVTHEGEVRKGLGAAASVVTDKGEGAYESDGAPSDERGDGDADDEGDDLLDDETDDLEADEGKADEEAPPQEGDEEAPAPKAEVKKPAEPFVVPTAGPFYMHDNRFGGEDAKRPGKGQKLWEGSADNDQRWPHDMFEKLNLANDVPPQRRGDSERGRCRRRGGGQYERGGRGEGAGYGGGRGGRGVARGARNNGDGGRRNFAAAQSAQSASLESSSALLPTPQYNLEVLQEFPPPPTNSQNWGSQPALAKQATANGVPNYANSREQIEKGGRSARGESPGGQKAPPAWADSVPGPATGWGEEVQERGTLPPTRGRGTRRGSGEGQSLGRGQGAGRGEYKPRAPQPPASGNNSSTQAAARGSAGWASAPGGQQPGGTQGPQTGYGRQATGWEDRPAGGGTSNQERGSSAPQGRNATVGTMTSPRQSSPSKGPEKRQQYQQAEARPLPAARREIEVQTDLAEVGSPPRNTGTTPRGGAAKAGPPPGFGASSGSAAYGSNAAVGTDYGVQYRGPVNTNSTGRSSPSLHLASDYIPNSASQQVLPYGQPAVPSVGGYGLPPYPGHLPPYGYGSSEVTWVPMLNNPQANTLAPPPSVYGANPYASPYSLSGAEASPYLYSSQAVAPAEYASAGAKQGPSGGAAISRPPSASTLWKPPLSGGLGTGALDTAADAYGQRQSKPRRYTEMTFQ